MIKVNELNLSHVAGLSMVALVVAVVGFVGNMNFGSRHIAALPEVGRAKVAQTSASDATDKIIAKLKEAPANVFGSARSLLPLQPSAVEPQTEAQSPTSLSKNWSDEEWRVAGKAVADFRSAAKSGGKSLVDMTALTWRPPEEIRGKTSVKSR